MFPYTIQRALGFTPGLCGVPGQFMNTTSLRVQSGTRISSSGISVMGPYSRVKETTLLHRKNDVDKAKFLANHFEAVFTRGVFLPETVPQSRIYVAKIEYAQITCGDVKRI